MAIERVKFKIQGHEKFALREGWLTKGLSIVSDNPRIFQDKNAPDVFGIGNNMVKSLRYWLKAFNLINEKPSVGATLTEIGEIIKQYDLYIEEYFTLNVLHSQIANNITEATSWYMYFNRCDAVDLEKPDIEKILLREISKYVSGKKFSENSLRNDVDVLLNMYSKSGITSDPEDKTVSPFTALKLVSNNEGSYTKKAPNRQIVSEWDSLFVLSRLMINCNSIAIEQFIKGEGGLNKTFNISSVVANEYLDKMETLGFIHVNRTAGLDVIYKAKEFLPVDVMKEYYKTHR